MHRDTSEFELVDQCCVLKVKELGLLFPLEERDDALSELFGERSWLLLR